MKPPNIFQIIFVSPASFSNFTKFKSCVGTIILASDLSEIGIRVANLHHPSCNFNEIAM